MMIRRRLVLLLGLVAVLVAGLPVAAPVSAQELGPWQPLVPQKWSDTTAEPGVPQVFIIRLDDPSLAAPPPPRNVDVTLRGEVDPAAVYIVQLEGAAVAAYRGDVAGLAATSPRVTGARQLDAESAASQAYADYLRQRHDAFVQTVEQRLGRPVRVVGEFNFVLNAVGLELSAAEAAEVATLPGVEFVQGNERRELHTDHGPGWIGAPALWGAAASCAAGGFCGEGVIVGIIDTGINHDHPSFADVGGDGYNHTNPFGSGNYKGFCASNPAFCNDKLVGAWDFIFTTTPEDEDGHGSHTASTAAGNFVPGVILQAPTTSFGLDISGVAPHANIIAYNACCLLFDLVAAIDQAVQDGVDVINYSIGGDPANPWTDSDAQAFLDAREAWVFVATSAGNSGPGAATLGSPGDAPWLLTVGASTHNRAFLNSLVDLNTNQGTALASMEGRSITAGYGPAAIVYAGASGNALCEAGRWPANQFSGQIVVCDRGVNGRVEKGANVKAAGGGGMVLANDAANGYGLSADAHEVPAVHISYADGLVLKNWLANGNSGHVGRIVGSTVEVGDGYGDLVASFSSRGPNPSTPRALKPDITGPGVDVVAAVASGTGKTPPEIDSYSGTSMSSPHLAGAAALLVDAHPAWTPAQIQSALMATARTESQFKDDGITPADPFDLGAGRVDLATATAAGFLLDETRAKYDAANPGSGGDPSTLNQASLARETCNNTCTWTRTLTSTRAGSWTVSAVAPAGVAVTASPGAFSFTAAGQSQTVQFTANVYGLSPNVWRFARVVFTEGSAAAPEAHFPVAVATTCSLPTAPAVSIALVGGDDVQLAWNNTGASSYEVWRSTSPYFTPGAAGSTKLTPANYTGTTYTDVNAVGGGNPDYFYKVIARNSCGGASPDVAGQKAVFSFGLVKGS